MDFDDAPDEAAYRSHVRNYLTEHASELAHGPGDTGLPAGHPRTEAMRRTQAVLCDGGLVGVTWPREYGGQGLTPMHHAIVDQELVRADIPQFINHIGLGMCGPTLIAHGTGAQRSRYLPRLLRADDIWCQLFSEPGAGSDLAGIRTAAVREGDGTWRVNGQKVWTTGAQFSRYGILLTRTDPDRPKHGGLTMFVLDMDSPGVTVRPLRQMSGESRFNEVYLDEVIVPDDQRIGDVHDGWRVALTTLLHERTAIGGDGRELGLGIQALLELALDRLPAFSDDERVRHRQAIGRAVVDSLATRYTGYRRLSKLSHGERPGPEASAGKLTATRSARQVADVGIRLLGPGGLIAADTGDGERWHRALISLPGLALAGGTNEILKNVIGERVLGLPPEPRVDKTVPFRAAKAGGA